MNGAGTASCSTRSASRWRSSRRSPTSRSACGTRRGSTARAPTSAQAAFDGLSFDTTPLDVRQAALEGVGFRFAEIADLMPEVEEVVATGGGLLKDEDWCQIMADALGRPLVVSAVEEASLRGAAVVALEQLGEEVADAPLGKTFEPRVDYADAYR